MKNKNKINFALLKHQQFSKYSSYDIPKEILEKNFELTKNIQDESEIIFKFGKLMGEYMVDQIKDDNLELQIKIIDNYSYIKKMIIKNPKYNLLQDDINNIYEDAIELLRYKYNKNELLSTNILNNMKYIILGKDNNIKIEKLQYDMSFLKQYIDLYEIDKGAYALVLGISIEDFDLILDGIKKVSNEDMYLICNLFETTSYDELKSIINDKINFHIYKEQLLKMKNDEKIQNEIISEKKKETIIDDIAYEFGAKDYEDLKDKIIEKIEIKKYNMNDNTKKLVKKK